MNFLIFDMLYKLVALILALGIIWICVRKFRSTILKDSLKDAVSKDAVAIAILEGLFFIGMVLLASKVIP